MCSVSFKFSVMNRCGERQQSNSLKLLYLRRWTTTQTSQVPNQITDLEPRLELDARSQDVFLETSRSDSESLLYGSTIRFYDPRIDAWRVTWINPRAGVVRTFIGRKSGGEIVMEGASGDSTPIRWIFSDIKSDSFHWSGEKRTGSTWRIYEELDAHRK